MVQTSNIRCPTARCVKNIETYGERYHWVYDQTSPPPHLSVAIARCEGCGGYWDGDKWIHKCTTCGADVEPGKLTGLFVPHVCADCNKKAVDAQRARGAICRRCNQVMSWCCC